MINSWQKKLLYVFPLSVLFSGVFFPSEKIIPYVMLFTIIIIFLYQNFLKILSKDFYSNKINLVFIFALIFWLCGIYNGIKNQYNTINIISNFAGISFYYLYFIYKDKFNRSELIPIIVSYACFYEVFQITYLFIYGVKIHLDLYADLGTSAIRAFWTSFGSLIIFLNIYTAVNFFKLFGNLNKYISGILSTIIIFVGLIFIIFTGSKGWYLAQFLVLLLCIFTFRHIFYNKICFYLSLTALVATSALFYYMNIFSILHEQLNLELNSQSVRSIQFWELYNDLTLFGKGLGAPVDSGYARDINLYGFELTFLNIIHKFGILSLPLLSLIFIPIVYSLLNIFNNVNLYTSILIIALMAYVIPGWGNPILFSPFNVIINVISWLILFGNKNLEK